MPVATLADVADHVEHVRRVAGVDHVGARQRLRRLQPDDQGLEDVSRFPALFVELARRGWAEDELAKLAGGQHPARDARRGARWPPRPRRFFHCSAGASLTIMEGPLDERKSPRATEPTHGRDRRVHVLPDLRAQGRVPGQAREMPQCGATTRAGSGVATATATLPPQDPIFGRDLFLLQQRLGDRRALHGERRAGDSRSFSSSARARAAQPGGIRRGRRGVSSR
jgi:hypothetical protein